jgi:hypothetical protein
MMSISAEKSAREIELSMSSVTNVASQKFNCNRCSILGNAGVDGSKASGAAE